MPYSFSSEGIFLNKSNLDLTRPLNAYVPNLDGTFSKTEIIKAGKVSIEDVKNFVANSGTVSDNDITTNGLKDDNAIASKFANVTWFDNGPLAMYQRLGSVAKSLGKNNTVGWMKDIGLPFELLASLGGGIFNGTALDDKVLEKLFPKNGIADLSMFDKLYESYYGYFGKSSTDGSYATNPPTQSEPGEADAFWNQTGNVLLGYGWQENMMKDNWRGDNFDESLITLPSPYGSMNIDSLGITKGITGEKLDNVYKFLRFAYNVQNANKITGGKALSPIELAKQNYKDDIEKDSNLTKNEKDRQLAFFDSSKGAPYEKVKGTIAAISTEGIYDIYNGQIGIKVNKILLNKDFKANSSYWIKQFNAALRAVWNEIEIRS